MTWTAALSLAEYGAYTIRVLCLLRTGLGNALATMNLGSRFDVAEKLALLSEELVSVYSY